MDITCINHRLIVNNTGSVYYIDSPNDFKMGDDISMIRQSRVYVYSDPLRLISYWNQHGNLFNDEPKNNHMEPVIFTKNLYYVNIICNILYTLVLLSNGKILRLSNNNKGHRIIDMIYPVTDFILFEKNTILAIKYDDKYYLHYISNHDISVHRKLHELPYKPRFDAPNTIILNGEGYKLSVRLTNKFQLEILLNADGMARNIIYSISHTPDTYCNLHYKNIQDNHIFGVTGGKLYHGQNSIDLRHIHEYIIYISNGYLETIHRPEYTLININRNAYLDISFKIDSDE